MAHFDKISEDLNKVASEIGDFIAQRSEPQSDASYSGAVDGGPSDAAPLELTETITVWQLTLKALELLEKSRRVPGDIADWVEPQPILHHQIRLRGKTVGFARSYIADSVFAKEDASQKIVFQISDDQTYAALLNKEFRAIDRNKRVDFLAEADPVVRLLEIPSYQVSVLWLFDENRKESRILVIGSAERYKALAPGALLTSEEFFESLRTGGPMIGVL